MTKLPVPTMRSSSKVAVKLAARETCCELAAGFVAMMTGGLGSSAAVVKVQSPELVPGKASGVGERSSMALALIVSS